MISSKMLRFDRRKHEFTRKIVQGTRFEYTFNGKKSTVIPVRILKLLIHSIEGIIYSSRILNGGL